MDDCVIDNGCVNEWWNGEQKMGSSGLALSVSSASLKQMNGCIADLSGANIVFRHYFCKD